MKQRHDSQDLILPWRLELSKLMALGDDILMREHDLLYTVSPSLKVIPITQKLNLPPSADPSCPS